MWTDEVPVRVGHKETAWLEQNAHVTTSPSHAALKLRVRNQFSEKVGRTRPAADPNVTSWSSPVHVQHLGDSSYERHGGGLLTIVVTWGHVTGTVGEVLR